MIWNSTATSIDPRVIVATMSHPIADALVGCVLMVTAAQRH